MFLMICLIYFGLVLFRHSAFYRFGALGWTAEACSWTKHAFAPKTWLWMLHTWDHPGQSGNIREDLSGANCVISAKAFNAVASLRSWDKCPILCQDVYIDRSRRPSCSSLCIPFSSAAVFNKVSWETIKFVFHDQVAHCLLNMSSTSLLSFVYLILLGQYSATSFFWIQMEGIVRSAVCAILRWSIDDVCTKTHFYTTDFLLAKV